MCSDPAQILSTEAAVLSAGYVGETSSLSGVEGAMAYVRVMAPAHLSM